LVDVIVGVGPERVVGVGIKRVVHEIVVGVRPEQRARPPDDKGAQMMAPPPSAIGEIASSLRARLSYVEALAY
jgi:hypothetical protein